MIFAVTVLLGAPSGSRAESTDLSNFFPPIEKLMTTPMPEGPNREAHLLAGLEVICPPHLKQKRKGCLIDEQISLYKAKLAILLNQDISPISVSNTQQASPWDLSELMSANFAPMPSPNGSDDGVNLVTEILYLRWQISQSLKALQETLNLHSRGLIRYTLIPSIKAYMMSSSPFGQALVLFNSIQCGIKDIACLNLQDRLGNVLNLLVGQSELEIEEVRARLKAAFHGHLGERMLRMGDILALNEYLIAPTTNLDKAELSRKLNLLAGDGQGAFADEAYQSLARNLIVVAEANLIASSLARFSPYTTLRSNPEIASAVDNLRPKLQQSLMNIKNSMALLGFNTELEEN